MDTSTNTPVERSSGTHPITVTLNLGSARTIARFCASYIAEHRALCYDLSATERDALNALGNAVGGPAYGNPIREALATYDRGDIE